MFLKYLLEEVTVTQTRQVYTIQLTSQLREININIDKGLSQVKVHLTSIQDQPTLIGVIKTPKIK